MPKPATVHATRIEGVDVTEHELARCLRWAESLPQQQRADIADLADITRWDLRLQCAEALRDAITGQSDLETIVKILQIIAPPF